MTTRQKIEVRLSKVRERLNVIAGLEGDDFNDDIRAESAGLEGEFWDLEVRLRAAILAESAEADTAAALFDDESGSAEFRQLFGRVSLGDYLAPAAAGSGIVGAAAELNAALQVPTAGPSGGVAVPWEVLEVRAFTTTAANDGPESQRPILQRLFGPGIADALGVRIDSVPVGRAEWPLITSGVAPAQAKETDAAADAVTAGFSFANLKPKRGTGRYEFTHEMAASVAGLEQALRRDLADAIRSKMADLLINGAAPTNNAPQNVEGFLTKLAAPNPLPTAAAAFADYAGAHALAVDGIHAQTEGEVSSVIGVGTYKHSAAVYQAGSGESGSEALRRRSRACVASSYIPAPPSTGDGANIQSALFWASGSGGTMRGDSVAAMWPTLEVIRDPYSKASQGVVLTWVTLWDAAVAFRSGAYRRAAFKLA